MKTIHRLLVALTFASLALPGTALAVNMLVPVSRSKAAKPAPEGLVGTMPVAFNAGEMAAMQVGESAMLALPNGKEYAVVLDRIDRHENGDLSWVGHFAAGTRDSLAIVTMGASASYATFNTPDGNWGVVPGEGNDWLFDSDFSNFYIDRPAGSTDVRVPNIAVPKAMGDPVACEVPILSTPSLVTIDVLYVMAPDFVSAHGGQSQASTRINNLITAINTYYVNSKIGIALRRVGTINVNYGAANGGPDGGTALDDITPTVSQGEPNRPGGVAPAFQYIELLRNLYAADMVVFLRGPIGNSISGIAWIGGYQRGPISSSQQVMYSVNGDSPAFSATLIAHEMGHNMGNNHDPANANGPEYGATSYAYGYTRCGTSPSAVCPSTAGFNQTGAGGFGTIMSYWRPTIPRFSNPNDTCTGNGATNVACGGTIASGSPAFTRETDETRAINCTRTDVSNMRNAANFAACANPTQDSDGDGLPNCTEAALGRNPNQKDNDIFGVTPTSTLLFTLQQYRDFLGREADPDGANYYMTSLLQGGLQRLQMMENFFNSPEFQSSGAPVARLYFAFFNRVPDYAGFIFQTNAVKSGASINSVANNFAQSPEFMSTYGSLNNTQYVTLLYQNVLGRTPSQAEINFHVNRLNTGATRGDVMAGFSESPEYIAARVNHVYVTMMYIGMLRRSPDQGGFDFWRNYIASGNSGQALINGFYSGSEYHSRFLP